MFKKLAIVAVIGVAGLWVAKKTHVGSYACTVVSSAKDHIRGQIPRSLELARVQNEIQQLDRDYQGLLGPIAEKMAAIKKLDREITTARANQQEQRGDLLALTKAIENCETPVSYQGSLFNADQAKVKLAREFAAYKRLETHLASKEKLLDAETKNLAAVRDQLDKLVTQKREFEIRLAQLEAEEETLNVARIQTPLQTDDSRVADIKRTLDRIEHAQSVETQQHVLQQQYGSKIGDAQPTDSSVNLDVSEIRGYLQGTTTKTTTKVVVHSVQK
jgi:chromosome segregation ATPase